jgi:hypothetical protein
MSSGQCKSGDNQGFPLTISQDLYSKWPGVDSSESSRRIKSITVPNEYSVKWPSPSYNTSISVVKPSTDNDVLRVTGLEPYTERTTLTYGDASYTCSNVLSIVQNQHPFFCKHSKASSEAILSFQINNKNENPSSPEIILFCRPLVITESKEYSPDGMWNTIDKASNLSRAQSGTVDLSSLYAYNASMLMPFIVYQTCIPVKLLSASPASKTTATTGSLRVRVNVFMQPLFLNLKSSELGSTSVKKYTLPKFPDPVGLFSNESLVPPTLQFKDGYGADDFPTTRKTNLTFSLATSRKTDFDSVINTIEIQVPEAFLGKSLNDISSTSVAPVKSTKKRPYKCYTIDPKKDIVDGQIMVDPATGEKLTEAQAQAEFGGDSNIDTDIDIETGIMPGDVEYALSVTLTVIGTLGLLGYLLFIVLKGREIFNTGGHIVPGGINEVLYHIVIFIMIFIALIVFGSLIENPAEPEKDS